MEQGLIAPDFGEIATQYARDIVSGKFPSCKWTRLACERHLADLARAHNDHADGGGADVCTAGGDNWPYTFNPELTDVTGKVYRPAERICRFAQLMPHI